MRRTLARSLVRVRRALARSLARSWERLWAFLCRALRAAKRLACDDRLPRWLRVLFVIGFLPVPGPFDEIVMLVAVALMAVFYRTMLTEAWKESEK